MTASSVQEAAVGRETPAGASCSELARELVLLSKRSPALHNLRVARSLQLEKASA